MILERVGNFSGDCTWVPHGGGFTADDLQLPEGSSVETFAGFIGKPFGTQPPSLRASNLGLPGSVA